MLTLSFCPAASVSQPDLPVMCLSVSVILSGCFSPLRTCCQMVQCTDKVAGGGGREECDFDVEEETTQGERPRRGGWGDIPSRCEMAPGPTVFKSAHKQKPRR